MTPKDKELTLKVTTLAEIIWYGIEWAEVNVEENPEDGSFTTLAHQIACAVCQWFNVEDGVETGETERFIFEKKLKSKQAVHRRLIQYLLHLDIEVSEWMNMSLYLEYKH